jgi:hypothetical protein
MGTGDALLEFWTRELKIRPSSVQTDSSTYRRRPTSSTATIGFATRGFESYFCNPAVVTLWTTEVFQDESLFTSIV